MPCITNSCLTCAHAANSGACRMPKLVVLSCRPSTFTLLITQVVQQAEHAAPSETLQPMVQLAFD